MRAARYSSFGGPEVIRVDDVDLPSPEENEVLVEVAATSFNPIDGALRAGVMAQLVSLPRIPNMDVAGTVAEVGPGVARWTVGDAVIGMIPHTMDGAAAEFAVVPADALAAAPTTLTATDAAALPLVGLTAWQAMTEHAQVRPGQRVLVHGAGGTVGRSVAQVSAHLGATVIASTRPEHLAGLRAIGVERAVDYSVGLDSDAVGGPVDVVYNIAPQGQVDLAALATLVRPGGVLVSAAAQLPPEGLGEVRGIRMAVHSGGEQLAEVVKLADAGGFWVDVAETCELGDLPDVHRRAATGDLLGKVVVVVKK